MQYLLDSMFYYKTEPIATIFLVSLVTMFISMIYIFQRAIADKDVHLVSFVILIFSFVGFVSTLSLQHHARIEVTNLEARRFELLRHDDKLEFISKDENLMNATLQIEDETENALYVRYKDKSFIVNKSYLTERN